MADNFEKLIEDLREEIKNGKIKEIKHAQSFIRDLFSCFGYEKYCFSKDLDFEVHTHAQDRADAIIGDEILIEMKSSNKSIDSEEVKSQVFNYNRFLGKPIVITCNFTHMNIYLGGENNCILNFNFLDFSSKEKKILFLLLHRDSFFKTTDSSNMCLGVYINYNQQISVKLGHFVSFYKKFERYIFEFKDYFKTFIEKLKNPKIRRIKLDIYENTIFIESCIYLYEILTDRLILLLYNVKNMINNPKYIKTIEELIKSIERLSNSILVSNIANDEYKVYWYQRDFEIDKFENGYNNVLKYSEETYKIFDQLIVFNNWLTN